MLATIILLAVINHRMVIRINRIIAGICCILTMSHLSALYRMSAA